MSGMSRLDTTVLALWLRGCPASTTLLYARRLGSTMETGRDIEALAISAGVDPRQRDGRTSTVDAEAVQALAAAAAEDVRSDREARTREMRRISAALDAVADWRKGRLPLADAGARLRDLGLVEVAIALDRSTQTPPEAVVHVFDDREPVLDLLDLIDGWKRTADLRLIVVAEEGLGLRVWERAAEHDGWSAWTLRI